MAVLLGCESLTKAFTRRPLFSGLTFDLSDGERVGLIGPNGAGKSTLLKLLAGRETPDSGNVALRRTTRLSYLPQEPEFEPGHTVEQAVIAALDDSSLEDYEKSTEVAIVLTKLGFADPEQPVATLSGGWKKRVAVARELVRQPTLMLLDEPTNHLDLEGVMWLERLLNDAPFAYLLVTHDRYFLQNATNQTIELNRSYPDGYFRASEPYGTFLERREEFLAGQAAREKTLANRVRREVEWLRRGPPARTGKSNARILEAGRLQGELAEVQYRNNQAGSVQIDFTATGRRTTKLLVAKDLAYSVAGRPLFRDLSFTLSPGTKLGLLGANGSGKSTLLRVLTGEAQPEKGEVVRAEGLRVVTFSQDRSQLDRAATLRKALLGTGDTVQYNGQSLHVTAWAKRFLFQTEQLDMLVGDLSGGEQARILIARLMQQPADLLLLDEPTNDLDIASLEVLEEGLSEFPGALVLVTHDRYLLDRLCTEILGLNNGEANLYSDFPQWAAAEERRRLETTRPKAAAKAAAKAAKEKEKTKKLTYQEQKELEGMEGQILSAEEAVAAAEGAVQAAGADRGRLQTACAALETAQKVVERLYARWAELEARRA